MHILLPKLVAAFALTWLWAMPATALAAAEDHNVVVIVDASGSMGQDLKGNRTNLQTPRKIVEARKYLSSFLKGLPAENLDAKIGLMAYGLGNQNDCQSVDVLIELGDSRDVGHLERMSTAVRKIVPSGKTPLTTALERAAIYLGHREHRSTIILVSDGEETCSRNPCEVAAQLEEQGIDLQVQVIGFAVSSSHFENLKCIAERTGGQLYSAMDGPDLGEKLFEALSDAVYERDPGEGEVSIPPSTALAQGPGTVTLEARVRGTEELIEVPRSSDSYGFVIPVDDGGQSPPIPVGTVRQLPQRFQLDPGEYSVRVKLDSVRAEQIVLLEPGQEQRAVIYFEPSSLTLTARSARNRRTLSAYSVVWTLTREGQIYRTIDGENPIELLLPRGSYEIGLEVGGRPVRPKRIFAFLGRSESLEFDTAIPVVSHVILKLHASPTDYFDIAGSIAPVVRLIRDEVGGPREVVTKGGRDVLIERDLEPGNYVLEIDYGGAMREQRFSLPEGEDLEAELHLAPGGLYVDTGDKGVATSFEIRHIDSGQEVRVSSESGVFNATLPPGQYQVTATKGERSSSGTALVKRQETTQLTLPLAATTSASTTASSECPEGTLGQSIQFGSGWLDLDSPIDFSAGDQLELLIGGTAKRVLVRLLPRGGDPNTQVGLLGGPVDVPADRLVRVTLNGDRPEITQISLHGGDAPFGLLLGDDNGPAALLRVRRNGC